MEDFDGYRFIGDVSTRWIPIEMYVKQIIGMLVTPDPELGRVLTWDASWSWLCQYLVPLVKQKTSGDNEAVELAATAKGATDIFAKDRNRIVHSTMEPLVGEGDLIEWHSFKLVGKSATNTAVTQRSRVDRRGGDGCTRALQCRLRGPHYPCQLPLW